MESIPAMAPPGGSCPSRSSPGTRWAAIDARLPIEQTQVSRSSTAQVSRSSTAPSAALEQQRACRQALAWAQLPHLLLLLLQIQASRNSTPAVKRLLGPSRAAHAPTTHATRGAEGGQRCAESSVQRTRTKRNKAEQSVQGPIDSMRRMERTESVTQEALQA
jgi:hypothetical protein